MIILYKLFDPLIASYSISIDDYYQVNNEVKLLAIDIFKRNSDVPLISKIYTTEEYIEVKKSYENNFY
jgi:hypothetical protein